MTITILDTTQITSSSSSLTGSYVNITGMDNNLSVVGTGSVILFMAQITLDGGADAESDFALFIDNSMVCEGRTAMDDNLDELGMVNLAWWVTGLSAGTHDFDVRAKNGGQTGGIVYTGEIRTSQVVEFTGADAPSILDTNTTTSSQALTSSYVDITGLVSNTLSITGGSSSLIVVTSTVSFASGADASAFLGLEIDTTIEAEGQCYQDASTEGRCVGLMFAKKGMTAGNHDFAMRAKEGQADSTVDVDMQIHQQIVEFTNNPTLAEVINETSGDTTATGSFTRLNNMLVTRTSVGISDFFLVCSASTFDSDSSDSGAFASIRIDGTDEAIGSSGIDANANEPGFIGLAFMKTGISGSVDFETMFKERSGSWSGVIAATDTARHLQVIEWKGVTYKLEGVTRDEGGSTLGNVRCILLKRDNVAEGSRIYTIINHVNSDGSGNYSFTGIGDNDSLYMVVSYDDVATDVRGATDDFLQPVIE